MKHMTYSSRIKWFAISTSIPEPKKENIHYYQTYSSKSYVAYKQLLQRSIFAAFIEIKTVN